VEKILDNACQPVISFGHARLAGVSSANIQHSIDMKNKRRGQDQVP
jgi:hypothetical protein